MRPLRHRKGRYDLLQELRRRLRGEPALPSGPIRRVLVICHGNVCRSPFAAHLLERQLPGCEIRSGGLLTKPGSPAEPGAQRTAARWDVRLDDHRAHFIESDDIRWADLIVGMQGHHLAILLARFPEASDKAYLLGDFLDSGPYGIVDPWGQPDEVFVEVFEKVGRSVDRLARRIQEAAS